MLTLEIPAIEALSYRQKLLSNPETMAYNRGYKLDDPFYNSKTGFIFFPPERWPAWYARWVGQEPERFYAYLMWKERPIGEISLHRVEEAGVYEMGIVIDIRRRGKGYSREGMGLLLEQAFDKMSATKVRNSFEPSRRAALRIHREFGFEVIGKKDGIWTLELTRETYYARRAAKAE